MIPVDNTRESAPWVSDRSFSPSQFLSPFLSASLSLSFFLEVQTRRGDGFDVVKGMCMGGGFRRTWSERGFLISVFIMGMGEG